MIESPKNQKIKDLVKLREGKHRRRTGTFLLEGDREIERALTGGFQLTDLFICQDFVSDLGRKLESEFNGMVHQVSPSVFEKIALRETTGGICAVSKQKYSALNELFQLEAPLLLVVESVEKPGNLGAILRTADGAGVDGVLILDEKADIFNPNSIRASLGAVFTVPVAKSENAAEVLELCHRNKVQIVAASPHSEIPYYDSDLTKSVAIVLGSEAFGLSDVWEKAGVPVKIPMLGVCDSLNVSVSAGVLVYEARRQRTNHNQ